MEKKSGFVMPADVSLKQICRQQVSSIIFDNSLEFNMRLNNANKFFDSIHDEFTTIRTIASRKSRLTIREKVKTAMFCSSMLAITVIAAMGGGIVFLVNSGGDPMLINRIQEGLMTMTNEARQALISLAMGFLALDVFAGITLGFSTDTDQSKESKIRATMLNDLKEKLWLKLSNDDRSKIISTLAATEEKKYIKKLDDEVNQIV
jgi:hypothetical protein